MAAHSDIFFLRLALSCKFVLKNQAHPFWHEL